MTKPEFLAAATRAALAASRISAFPPGITVSQAALESNWGQSRLARDAHNYFGIKAHGAHARVTYPTLEHVNGRDLRVIAQFACYDSMEECFADRDRLIANSSCYSEARSCRTDPVAFARALAAHWATDPRYAEKLLRVYRENRLDTLDSESPITRSLNNKEQT
ncbi:MAG: glucosaminidase domain-containing protein [Acidobacteriia bacterium]|nr:glucosaminidase domain-containing protein [Terriglobia bacterium]